MRMVTIKGNREDGLIGKMAMLIGSHRRDIRIPCIRLPEEGDSNNSLGELVGEVKTLLGV